MSKTEKAKLSYIFISGKIFKLLKDKASLYIYMHVYTALVFTFWSNFFCNLTSND